MGNAKPAVIRTDSDYWISYSNISLSGGSFYHNHDLINNDVELKDSANNLHNPTPENLSNKDVSKYDGSGLTFIPYKYNKLKNLDEYRDNIPAFSLHAGSPGAEDNNADGSRNNLGAFGGRLGNGW